MPGRLPIPEDRIEVGRVLKPYGLKGEVKIRPLSHDPGRHSRLRRVFLVKGDETAELEVESSRLHRDLWYLRFRGLRTPEAVKPFAGASLQIAAGERLELPPHQVYTSDIIGFDARDPAGRTLGVVRDVRELAGQILIVLSRPKGEMLVPWAGSYVCGIDQESRRVTMDISPLEGLDAD